MLSRVHKSILEIPASKVLRRVVAVSRADFDAIKYKDETMFYYDEDDEDGEDGEDADIASGHESNGDDEE